MASGLGMNAQPLEKLMTLEWTVTSDPAYFGLLNFMNIYHHINLLLINSMTEENPFPQSTTSEAL